MEERLWIKRFSQIQWSGIKKKNPTYIKARLRPLGAEECRKGLWGALVALQGLHTPQHFLDPQQAPHHMLSDTSWKGRAPYLSGLYTILIMPVVRALGRLSPWWLAVWLRTSADNWGVPGEPPSGPSPCPSCSTADPHLNSCLLFFSKKL